MSYDPRRYWDEVADQISSRQSGSDLAGYDSPLDRYVRAQVAERLAGVPVAGKAVMEVGSGSGLNLRLFDQGGAQSITAVDVSAKMLGLAMHNMHGSATRIKYVLIDGRTIPLTDRSVDLAFTVTVLQHNSNLPALDSLIGEIARVTRERVYLFEDTAPVEKGSPEFVMRPVEFYRRACERHGLRLAETQYISLYYTQKLFSFFNRITGLYRRKEGAATPWLARALQRPFLPLTAFLDRTFPRQEGNTMMVFERGESGSGIP